MGTAPSAFPQAEPAPWAGHTCTSSGSARNVGSERKSARALGSWIPWIPAATNQSITAINLDTCRADPGFLLHVLNYRVRYWRGVASSSRKDPNITKGDVRRFPVRLPHITEQRAIAEVRHLGQLRHAGNALGKLREQHGGVRPISLSHPLKI